MREPRNQTNKKGIDCTLFLVFVVLEGEPTGSGSSEYFEGPPIWETPIECNLLAFLVE